MRIMRTIKQQRSLRNLWRIFSRRKLRHDPLLVLSMEDFNFADGWSRCIWKQQLQQLTR